MDVRFVTRDGLEFRHPDPGTGVYVIPQKTVSDTEFLTEDPLAVSWNTMGITNRYFRREKYVFQNDKAGTRITIYEYHEAGCPRVPNLATDTILSELPEILCGVPKPVAPTVRKRSGRSFPWLGT